MKRFALGFLVFCFHYILIYSMEEGSYTSEKYVESKETSELTFIQLGLLRIPILERSEEEMVNLDLAKTVLKSFKRVNEEIEKNPLLLLSKTDIENHVKEWAKRKFAPEYDGLDRNELNEKLEKSIILIHAMKPELARQRIALKACPEWNDIIKLIIAGADPNSFVNPSSCVLIRDPLLMSIYFKDIDMIRLSLHYGANLKSNSYIALPPLHTLISYNLYSIEEIEELTELFISYGAELESRDMLLQTPLIRAAKGNYQELVKFFAEKGANVNALDFSKRSALSYVGNLPNKRDLYDYLIAKGANDSIPDEFGNTPDDYINGRALGGGI